MKILVAPDSFKESLSAIQVAEAISKGVLKIIPNAEIIKTPISDGGEGLLDALVNDKNGKIITVKVYDPLYRSIAAEYGILNEGTTAVIEMAKASGLELLKEQEKNPDITSSYGTGQLILDALDRGCQKIIIGIGGSATNDGGMGMVKALGGKFINKEGVELTEGGGALGELSSIDLTNFDKRISNCKIVVACDVTNKLTGENGASFVYGAQKGGSKEQLEFLDKNLEHYAAIIRNHLGIEIENINGAGAGGGMGAGLIAFLNAELKSGIDLILETLEIKKHIKNIDLIITGEGKIDKQTLQGKTILGIAALAKEYHVPVIAITGKIGDNIDEIYKLGITSIFSIVNKPMKLEEAINDVEYLIQSCIETIIRTIKLYQSDKF
ncbi:MAG TPA: glycerate kinase [Flavobacteriaceae bacterium]|jgi:glycerate kinase|nr:glycerate kinase [Flavobacteriaceae bacterium]